MARVKTWGDGDPFTASDANSLSLEVPPAATNQVASQVLAVVGSGITNASGTTASVLRQGLQCSISARVIVAAAGFVTNTSTRLVYQLPQEFWPKTQQDLPIFGDGGRLHILFILTNGQVHVAASSNGYSAHGANYPIGCNASWMVPAS